MIDAGAGWDEYLWSNAETTQVITVDITENTSFSVTVTDTGTGCEFSDTVTIDAPTGCPDPCDAFDPYEITDVTQPTCEDITAVINAGDGWDEYLWSNDETTQVISVEITDNSTFSVTVTDTDTGCEFSDEVTINVPTGCENSIDFLSDQPVYIELYPNPASGLVTLEYVGLNPGQYTTEIMDVTGKLLIRKENHVTQSKGKYIINLTEYPEGLYLIKIAGNNFNHCERLLLK
jgi:hypothetical protein